MSIWLMDGVVYIIKQRLDGWTVTVEMCSRYDGQMINPLKLISDSQKVDLIAWLKKFNGQCLLREA